MKPSKQSEQSEMLEMLEEPAELKRSLELELELRKGSRF